jgi:hypothetical protein
MPADDGTEPGGFDRDARSPIPHPTRPPRYWFPAKTYGWGWGVPCTWEGWLVLVAYIGLTIAVAWICPPERSWPGFLAGVYGLAAAMILVCWWTGEPPAWRWGRKDSR